MGYLKGSVDKNIIKQYHYLIDGDDGMNVVKKKLWGFFKKEVVLSIAILCTLVTICFIPFDKEYLDYFEMKTLISLFCMLAVVAGLKNTNVFELISKKLIGLFKSFVKNIPYKAHPLNNTIKIYFCQQ